MRNYKNLHIFLSNFIKNKAEFDQDLVKSKSRGKWKLIEARIDEKKIPFLVMSFTNFYTSSWRIYSWRMKNIPLNLVLIVTF